MANPQTTFINESTVLCGAHVLYATKNKPVLPANFSSLTDEQKVLALVTAWKAVSFTNCGALDEGKLSGENKSSKREVQNVADKTIVSDQTAKYTAKLYELMNPVVEPILAAGLSSFVNVPGTAVTGATHVIPAGFSYGKAYILPFKNASKAAPTITTVSAATDGTLTLNEDYIIQPTDVDGEYAIAIIDSAAVTTNNQAIAITASYTPAASRIVGTGGKTDVDYIAIKIACENESGDVVEWIVPKCTSTKGFEYAAKKYNDEKNQVAFDVEINGELELSYPKGFQLYFRIDEVNVA